MVDTIHTGRSGKVTSLFHYQVNIRIAWSSKRTSLARVPTYGGPTGLQPLLHPIPAID